MGRGLVGGDSKEVVDPQSVSSSEDRKRRRGIDRVFRTVRIVCLGLGSESVDIGRTGTLRAGRIETVLNGAICPFEGAADTED